MAICQAELSTHQQLQIANYKHKLQTTTSFKLQTTNKISIMTRTHKWTVHEGAAEQKYFTHNGHADMDPNKVSKQGNGKFNWGKPGDELQDQEEMAGQEFFGKSARRNSNHAQNEQLIKETTEKCDEKMKN